MSTALDDFRDRRLPDVRERYENADEDVRTVGWLLLACATLLAAVLAFAPQLYTVPVLVLLGAVAYSWVRFQEATAKLVMFLMTVSTVLVLGLITVFLVLEAVPAFQHEGLDLLTRTAGDLWDANANQYSLVPMMWGTFATTVLAMLVAAPLGVAGALFISELAPPRVRSVLKPAVEMLAGIPSIVYGFLGYQIVNAYVMEQLQLPIYGSLFVVGVVIGVMALPTVVSVAEDAIDAVPGSIKDGSAALGATGWQTVTSVTLPAAFSGVSAAVLLGVGRAVGETMAATVILAHSEALPQPLYDVFGPLGQETLTSLIASQYGVAEKTHLSALFAAGVVLFVTVMLVSVASQYIQLRMERKLGGDV